MKFSTPILAAVAALYPTTVDAYSLFGPSLFEPSLSTFSPMMRRQRALANRPRYYTLGDATTFKQLSPRYEIVNTNEQVQIAMDVPGVKMEDVDVSLEDGGKLLTIRGSRRARNDESSFASKFSQSFSLEDPVIDVDNLSAHLVDGVLTVSAPKDANRLEQNIKSIPILDTAPPAFVDKTPKMEASEEAAVEEPIAVATEEKEEEVVDLDAQDSTEDGVSETVEAKVKATEEKKDDKEL